MDRRPAAARFHRQERTRPAPLSATADKTTEGLPKHIGPQRRERGEPTGAIIPVVVAPVFVTMNINDQIVARGPHLDPIDLAKKGIYVRLVHEAFGTRIMRRRVPQFAR